MVYKGAVVKVENSDTYVLTDVTRDSTGEYKCALIDNSNMESSENITVNCKSPLYPVLHFCRSNSVGHLPVNLPRFHILNDSVIRKPIFKTYSNELFCEFESVSSGYHISQ